MKKLLILLILLTSVLSVYGFDWPVKKVILTSTFGESRGDHFHTGIDLGGGAQPVFPISSGRVVFRYNSGQYSSVPIGLGNFIVLQHKGNIRSIYCHLKDNSIKTGVRSIAQSDQLGIIGDTGHSYGKHLHLSIIDFETHSILNPLTLLPPVKDKQPPIIKNVWMKTGDEEKKISETDTVKPSRVEILAEIYDLREDVSFIWKLAPYTIVLYENGVESARITFNSIVKNSGKLVLSGSKKSFTDIYASDWIYRLGSIELLEGENHLLILVKDFAGNESTRNFFIKAGKSR